MKKLLLILTILLIGYNASANSIIKSTTGDPEILKEKAIIELNYKDGIYKEDYLINLDGVHTNVTYAMSLLYKKNDGTQASALKYHPNVGNEFSPVNVGVVPTITPINPHNYTLVLP